MTSIDSIRPLDCDAVAELLPVYALDALDDAERAAVEAHLEGCDLHEEALAFERTAARLSEVAPQREPPPALRGRILAAAADLEAAPGGAVDPPSAATEPPPAAVEPPPPLRIEPRRRWLPLTLAAAVVAVLIAFVSLNALGGGDEGTVRRTAVANGITSTLVYNASDEAATVEFEDLPALEADQTYQLWTIAPGASPASAGLLIRLDDGTASQALSGSFETGTTFAITVEPAGGSDQPTTEPLVATQL